MSDNTGATAYPPEHQAAPPAKKKRRIFMWFFLIVQVLFIIWIITGIASGSGDATDCGSLSQEACNNAEDVGTGIGVVLLFIIWMVVDFLLFIPWVVIKLARR